MAHRLSLLQNLADRRYLGEDQPGHPQTVAGGEDKGKDWVEKELGWSVDLVERPRQAAPKDVLMAWTREWAKEGVKVDWEHLLPLKAFRFCREDG